MNSMKQRLEWLDAMRGFTMILVVAYHVAQSGFMESEKISASLPFLVLFRMPLFFFVSGFLAYKEKWLWTPQNFASLTWKKIKPNLIKRISSPFSLAHTCHRITDKPRDPQLPDPPDVRLADRRRQSLPRRALHAACP